MIEKAAACEETVAKGRQVVVKVTMLSNHDDLSNLVGDEKLYTQCITYFLRGAIKQAISNSTVTLHLYEYH